MRFSQKQPGLALIELLVVTGIFALLLGLFLPAVLKAREAAAQTSCADRLRQMGTAIHQFAATHDGLLPANPPDDAPTEHRGSHVTRVLPYLGYEKLARAYHAALDWAHPDNAAVIKTDLPVLHCPSAPDPQRLITGIRPEEQGGTKFTAAPSDYVAVTGITNALVPALFPETFDRRGVIPTAVPRKLSDIPDGAAATLMIVEIADKPNIWRAGKRVDTPDTNEFGYGAWAAPTNANNPRGYSWDGTGFPGPCPMNCSNLYSIYAFHPGGSNILFADASVKFVKQSMDVWVLYALITSNGNEILAPGDY
ncbi:MAG: DUF1559 domain-containing protein [Bacteroidales bacterium]|nr:DUF1559 domain-containing protein [Bacteroidales bacterium]